MARQMHLNKTSAGMASKTACGRNILRTPMSTNWRGFLTVPADERCAKCNASRQFAVNQNSDAKKALLAEVAL